MAAKKSRKTTSRAKKKAPARATGTRDISLTDPDGFKITIAVPKR